MTHLSSFVPPPPPPPAGERPMTFGLDERGAVASDLPCRRCAYNLRGMPLSARCPECGAPVGAAVHGDLLRYAEPSWVERLRRGTLLILTGILVLVVALVLTLVLVVVGTIRGQMGTAGEAFALLVGFIGALLTARGGWLLTTPDPGGLGEDKYGAARRFVRVALVVNLAYHVVDSVGERLTLSPLVQAIATTGDFVLSVLYLAGLLAELYYLERLALRVPDPAASRRARFLRRAFAWSYGAMIVLGAVMNLAGVGTPGGTVPAGGGALAGMVTLGCGATLAGVALLAFGIMYVLMLWRLAGLFKTQAARARETWAAAEQAGASPPPPPAAPLTAP